MSDTKGPDAHHNGGEFVTREEFHDAIRELGHELARRIDKISENVNAVEQIARPNFSVMAAWASVIVSVGGLLGGGMFYHFNTRFALQDQSRTETFHQLNTRIERVENLMDEDKTDEVRRYRDLLNDRLKPKE